MPELINDKQVFSLFEVSKSIKSTLEKRYKNSYWIKAEMNKLNYYIQSGHCYPDLVEKDEGNIKAQIRANLWRDDYVRINNNFLSVLKEPLKDGIKILFLAKISFDPVYGLSLRIIDIDPSYTLGDLEKEKNRTIERLKSEGIFERNKQLKLPLLPQRIAIISVESSRGYADFKSVIDENPWQYAFFQFLFPSLLQGEKAVASIISQLNKIRALSSHFDVVLIIRGGGGDVGLSCYNNYELAREISLFPIPVITGIGHATNWTVVEMVAFENAITPTKLAEYLLQKFHNFAVPVKEAHFKIADKSWRFIQQTKNEYFAEIKLFKFVCENILNVSRGELKNLYYTLTRNCDYVIKNELQNCQQEQNKINPATGRYYKNEFFRLEVLSNNIRHLHPDNVLKRGYSISLFNGKALKDITNIKKGDEIKTIIYKGEITSQVKSKKTNKNE
ncbi:MAG: exodeoxyribonuclease VII large subunit [Bacteroidales bacterium]|nr:exodeoxyribonuclease VII large subunit [Bacteroidales bacterium]